MPMLRHCYRITMKIWPAADINKFVKATATGPGGEDMIQSQMLYNLECTIGPIFKLVLEC